MTRDEQMWEAVTQEHGDLSMRDAFLTLTAMEWADKTIIDKACEWLDKNITNYESNMMGYIEYSQINDIIQDFRKAMLEEE